VYDAIGTRQPECTKLFLELLIFCVYYPVSPDRKIIDGKSAFFLKIWAQRILMFVVA
jgi:hypothetical protein